MKRYIAVAAALLLLPVAGQAEDLNTIFENVNKFVGEKNYPKALEELKWASKEIEKLNSKHMASFLPDELAGYSAAGAEANSAMGITNIERKYTKGSEKVKVSITNMGGAGGAGGIAAIGRMAALMGNQPGMDSFRIQGKTATLQQRQGSKRAELSVYLDSGAMLKLESSNLADSGVLKKMVEELKVSDLDNYLRGMAG